MAAANHFFVRAQYDFASTDPSSLSFKKDEVIEVLTQLESGWWDGILENGLRGWFPSNYVTSIDAIDMPSSQNSTSQQTQQPDANAQPPTDEKSSDYWIPQATADGNIYYLNTRTGESSWDLPVDDMDESTMQDDFVPSSYEQPYPQMNTTIQPHQNSHQPSPYLNASQQGSFQSLTPSIPPPNIMDSQRRPSIPGSVSSSHLASSSNLSRSATPTSPILSRSKSAAAPPNMPNLPEPWIMQPTDDGSTYYFLNSITKEIRWTHPNPNGGAVGVATLPSATLTPTLGTPGTSTPTPSGVPSVSNSPAPQDRSLPNEDSIPPQQASVAAEYDNRPLPPNWTRKIAASGKVMYINPRTGQTAGSISSIDMTTGRLKRASHASLDSEILKDHEDLGNSPVKQQAAIQPVAEPLDGLPQGITISWTELANHVYDSIEQLNESAAMADKSQYTTNTNLIVEAVRIMLYVSGTIDKDSPSIRQHRSLKIHHRHIMASLSKLVLSTKVASGVWPPQDAVSKMQSDSSEVYAAIRQFVQVAQDSGLEIHRINPKLHGDGTGGAWAGNGLANGGSDKDQKSYTPSQQPGADILNVFDLQARSVTKAIAVLHAHVRKSIDTPKGAASNIALAPQLISQARAVAAQVGQFLQAAEDLNLGDLADQIFVDDTQQSAGNSQSSSAIIAAAISDYQVAKQSLYNNVASLILTVQYATLASSDVIATREALEKVNVASDVVDKTAQQVIASTRFLVEEKELLDSVRLRGNGSAGNTAGAAFTTAAAMTATASAAMGSKGVRRISSLTFNGNRTDDMGPNSGYAASDSSLGSGLGITTGRSPALSRERTFDNMSDVTTLTSAMGGVDYGGVGDPAAGHDEMYGDMNNLEQLDDEEQDDDDFDLDETLGSGTPKRNKNSKLQKIFGDDAPLPTTKGPGVVTKVRDDIPWYLGYNYDPSDIVFNMEGHVKGGTLTALVERLTMHDLFDSSFNNTFLLTYRSFTSTEEFFNLLVARYLIQPPEGLTKEHFDEWTEKKQTPIRLRVYNVMKSWLDSFFLDEDDEAVLEKIQQFANNVMAETMPAPAQLLTRLVEKRQQNQTEGFRKLVLNMSMQAPPPILPKNLKKLKFIEMDPLELARQLTIIESRLYNKIKPVECLNKAWSRDDGADTAENIKAMILNSNQITGWVAEAILNQYEIKKRINIIKHFVGVAEHCRKLNNFSTLTAIISGLNSAPIHRLKRTWEMANAKTMTTLEQLNKVMQSTKNFSEYREMIHGVNPPCVPFLGVYLTDLTFIEDGNPNQIKKSKNLINFSKRMKTAEVIREIQVYQAVPYCLTPVSEFQTFIKSHLQESRDVGDLYQQSLEMEPRERDDEKIARLLQESGFL